MKTLKILLPPVFGILTTLGILVLFNLIVNNGDAFAKPDNGFLNILFQLPRLLQLQFRLL